MWFVIAVYKEGENKGLKKLQNFAFGKHKAYKVIRNKCWEHVSRI
jgi:hypothetical protein